MLTLEDCLDLCHLTPEEIEAVANHEHTDPLHAIATAEQLLQTSEGPRTIELMIVDEIMHAQTQGHLCHARKLRAVLLEFMKNHPHNSTRIN